MLSIVITVAVCLLGYWQARKFVHTRLRFVDAVHRAAAPAIAGVGAFLIAWPFTLLPLIHVTTAIIFGASVAVGVNAGARDIRRRIGAGA